MRCTVSQHGLAHFEIRAERMQQRKLKFYMDMGLIFAIKNQFKRIVLYKILLKYSI
tara:strand:- start:332 stop:499 length:168 start_codon:yes stop_codon:yes gene_type:complete